MNVISVPLRLRFAVASIFSCIPFIMLEVIVIARSSWWNLPYSQMAYWALAWCLICIPLAFWLLSGKKWAFKFLVFLALVWIAVNSWLTLRTGNPVLGFFSVGLLFFWVCQVYWLRRELNRSFFDPKMSWFQGLPKPIPGLVCRLFGADQGVDLQVGRIDREGLFVFFPFKDSPYLLLLSSISKKNQLEMVLTFRDWRVTCQGIPILALSQMRGLGIQFKWTSSDIKKDMGDFVEVLHEEGYV